MKTNFKQSLCRDESGFTLLELLLVVGVGALLLIGGISTYRLVSDNNKTTEAVRMLLTIKQETQALYQTRADYNGLDNDILTRLNVIPESEKHSFNGTITVAVSTGDDQLFDVTFADVTGSGCFRIATAGFNPDDLVDFTVDGESMLDASGEVDIGLVSGATGCPETGFADMVWTFR